MLRIRIEREKCIGCLTCTTACVVSHGGGDTRTHITIDAQGRYAPIFCRHCEKPECVYTCMSGAMRKDFTPDMTIPNAAGNVEYEASGMVLYDESRCAHCYMCIMNCPYGVLKMDAQTNWEVMKCDYCRNTEFGTPQCVANCPAGCISLEEVED